MADHAPLRDCIGRWSRQSPTALLIAGVGLVAIAASTHTHAPVLIWNASPSSPTGLYLVTGHDRLRVGDMVVARPPAEAAGLADRRGYLPSTIPLVKTVAATTGDRVCARGEVLAVNGRALVRRRPIDRAGRALPGWAGCRNLRPRELLLLGLADPGSFDSRYFGPVASDRVVGRARLVWPG